MYEGTPDNTPAFTVHPDDMVTIHPAEVWHARVQVGLKLANLNLVQGLMVYADRTPVDVVFGDDTQVSAQVDNIRQGVWQEAADRNQDLPRVVAVPMDTKHKRYELGLVAQRKWAA